MRQPPFALRNNRLTDRSGSTDRNAFRNDRKKDVRYNVIEGGKTSTCCAFHPERRNSMRERIMSRALIIGGGIGGLCAAIALRQAGIDVTVFERVTEMQEVGAGLTLWTNAVWALQKLGLTDALQAIGTPCTRATIYSWQGEILSETPVDELLKK